MASLWANYTLHSGLARGFGFGGGVRYVGFSYGDEANSFKVPAFTLVDATLHYDFGEMSHVLRGYRIQVNANNLFDKSYVASCFSSEGCYFGLRRTVYATLKFDW
jgi:iron complex outermembrane recepter protein